MKKAIFAAAVMAAAMVVKPSAPAAQDIDWSHTAECANDVLQTLVGWDHPGDPYIPVFHTALMAKFLLCTPSFPLVDSILSAMREDIETIYRHREEFPDITKPHRTVVCTAWLTIYIDVYDRALYLYGTISVADLPTPETRWADCQRWSG